MTETIQVKKNSRDRKAKSNNDAAKTNSKIDVAANNENKEDTTKKDVEWKWEFEWGYIFFYIAINIGAFYGIYLIPSCKWLTLFLAYFYGVFSGFGVTAGVHRLWAHRCYKAKLPLRILLAILFTASGQRSIYEWSVGHRVHHKYSDTDADPHNSNRGFFFCHIGWTCIKPHPECIEKTKRMYKDDLEADPVVYWQHKLYHPLLEIFCFIIPTLLPVYLWDEDITNAFFVCAVLRTAFVSHGTFCVNSFTHMYGYKAYDIHIKPCKNSFVTWLTSGEGFHNYHHTFPRDYAACEFSNHKANKTTKFIDFFARYGLAYDRIKVDPETIRKRRMRTGDWSLMDKNNDAVKEAEKDGSCCGANKTNGHSHHHHKGPIEHIAQLDF